MLNFIPCIANNHLKTAISIETVVVTVTEKKRDCVAMPWPSPGVLVIFANRPIHRKRQKGHE